MGYLMRRQDTMSNPNNKSAAREAGQIDILNLPLRVNLVKHGRMDSDFSTIRGNWLVETDFHRTGKIKNGPEARIAEMDSDDSASNIGDFSYSIGHKGAKSLAKLFAGSPRLMKAAREVLEATSKEGKFKHNETYRALTELMGAVEAIVSDELIFNPNLPDRSQA